MDSTSSSLNLYAQEVNKSYSSSAYLHSVRKPPMKPWKKQIVTAAIPPTPPRVYKVDAYNFRQVVQELTGVPKYSPEVGCESVTTSTINTSTSNSSQSFPKTLNLNISPPSSYNEFLKPFQIMDLPVGQNESCVDLPKDGLSAKDTDGFQETNFFGLYSPTWYTCSSLPLLSPGAISAFEQSTVL